ncbi:AbrB/MazE/SpoVT family DNA-binding domain-containing protein [Microbacterium phyllosphaerae]|uniref:AbrB/MazE/SpoVT family DNA-binding domain-containing protein n=1 Tax=Microbacterium phyllosphaerae TaxID=124798 RepID=UPI002168B999|nr:AbrB/MazE/SpoVT family DNA-binding domain-containing protein [Microbacterium phyllosphaerae]MCS3442945.1 AbrB family looped-hinge helix DNA binding protein [Microbacterium phyllosphaerae]
MRTTIDKAGRVVIPASIRERLGMLPGPVDIMIDGTGIRIEIAAPDNIEEKDGRLVIRGGGSPLTADEIRELRLADQR